MSKLDYPRTIFEVFLVFVIIVLLCTVGRLASERDPLADVPKSLRGLSE